MSFNVDLTTQNDVLIIRLEGELDHHTTEKLRNQVENKMTSEKIRHIILNVKGLSFMDSSGLGVILGRYKQVTQWGGKMIVCEISPSIYRLFQLSGLFKILEVTDSEEQALIQLGVH